MKRILYKNIFNFIIPYKLDKDVNNMYFLTIFLYKEFT